jgi:hypothetical protein
LADSEDGLSYADNQLDARGCLWTFLRLLGCMSILYIIMFGAIIAAGIILTLFF